GREPGAAPMNGRARRTRIIATTIARRATGRGTAVTARDRSPRLRYRYSEHTWHQLDSARGCVLSFCVSQVQARTLAFRIVTAFLGRSESSVGVRLIASTTSIPLTTRPNAGCFGSSRALSTTLMKNWLPQVFGPAFAMEIVPRAFRLSEGSSSLIA